MPIVNTWIKNEDWDTYYQLASTKQWGEFVHNALNSNLVSSSSEPIIIETNGKPVHEGKLTKTVRHIGETYISKAPDMLLQKNRYNGDEPNVESEFINTPDEALEEVKKRNAKAVRESLNRLCKIHAIPLDINDKCLQKGCKYA